METRITRIEIVPEDFTASKPRDCRNCVAVSAIKRYTKPEVVVLVSPTKTKLGFEWNVGFYASLFYANLRGASLNGETGPLIFTSRIPPNSGRMIERYDDRLDPLEPCHFSFDLDIPTECLKGD